MGEHRGLAKRKPKRAARFALSVTVASLACLASAGSSPAAGGGSDRALQFSVDAGNGFDLFVDARRERGEQRARASVTLSSPDQAVVYSKDRGVRMTHRELAFEIGTLGSVDVRLRRSRRIPIPPPCRVRTGRFTGRIHFRGENGYTRAHASKARGMSVSGAGRDRCGFFSQPSPAGNPGRDEAVLNSCGPGPRLGFTAAALFGDYALFRAMVQEQETNGLGVLRFAYSDGRAGDEFSFDEESYRSAKVRPPWPFSGTGAYRDGELRGDLSVSFAGREPVPLVPSSRANLRKSFRGFGRTCGIEFGTIISASVSRGISPYAISGSAPEDPAAVGF